VPREVLARLELEVDDRGVLAAGRVVDREGGVDAAGRVAVDGAREQVERGGKVRVADVRDGRVDVDLAQDCRRQVELTRRAVQPDEQDAAAAPRSGERGAGSASTSRA
jgi:hypothetical protein